MGVFLDLKTRSYNRRASHTFYMLIFQPLSFEAQDYQALRAPQAVPLRDSAEALASKPLNTET